VPIKKVIITYYFILDGTKRSIQVSSEQSEAQQYYFDLKGFKRAFKSIIVICWSKVVMLVAYRG